jgi:hypothetical protein
MTDIMDVSDIFENGTHTIRMTSGTPPKIAAIDVVMSVTGKNNHRAAQTLRELEIQDDRLFVILEKHKFPGRGQTEIIVVNCSQANQLVMMLPGKEAQKFKQNAAKLLTRVFAGDPTLHDVIEENRQSDGFVNQIARDELASEGEGVGEVDNEQQKLAIQIKTANMRKELSMTIRDTIECEQTTAEDQVAHKKRMFDSESAYIDKVFEYCSKGMPVAQQMWMTESKRNCDLSRWHTHSQGGPLGIENGQAAIGGPMYSDDMEPVTISTHIIKAKGLTDPGNKMAMGIGTIAVRMYREQNDGLDPPSEKIMCNGNPIDVKKYFKKDMPLLEEAYTEFEEKTKMAETQKEEKEMKKAEQIEKKRVQANTRKKAKDKSALEDKQSSVSAWVNKSPDPSTNPL